MKEAEKFKARIELYQREVEAAQSCVDRYTKSREEAQQRIRQAHQEEGSKITGLKLGDLVEYEWVARHGFLKAEIETRKGVVRSFMVHYLKSGEVEVTVYLFQAKKDGTASKNRTHDDPEWKAHNVRKCKL